MTIHFQSPFAKLLLMLMVLPAGGLSEGLGGQIEMWVYERKQNVEMLGRAEEMRFSTFPQTWDGRTVDV